MRFVNTSAQDTPILRDIRVLDLPVETGTVDWRVNYAEGSHERITDFQPQETLLSPSTPLNLGSFGGRPSDGFLPFFNLHGDNGGVMIGLGWTGQWTASFLRGDGQVHVTAGMATTHFLLHPGEEVRSPSVLLLPWQGNDRLSGQNRFRKFLLKHYVPHFDGKPVQPFTAASPHGIVPFEGTTEENVCAIIQNIAAHKLPVDCFWIDAGWSTCIDKNWARSVGNLGPDPARFPNGLKPVADAAHRNGMKFLLWFEPERVMPDTNIFQEHRDWLIAPPQGFPKELRYQYNDKFHLFNLGNPDARVWMANYLNHSIDQFGIDVYRNDFNMYPNDYWRSVETPDRQGIAEIRYVEGLYSVFDALKQSHPALLLDTCASGGRRIDLEMLKRALILTRSDYLWDPIGQQCHTLGLAQWLPITGIGAADVNRYNCRSGYGAHFALAANYRSDDPAYWEDIRHVLTEFKSLAPLTYGDFYPLTPYSIAADVWLAWQFHREDLNEGFVQAFRRQNGNDERQTLPLHGLDASANYLVTNLDDASSQTISGADLMKNGLAVSLPSKPAAAVFTYKTAP
jgi:alpha-galactosidase